MHIIADDPVGRALPYLRINEAKLHAGSFSPQSNRSFGVLDTRDVNIVEVARAQEIANRQGLSGGWGLGAPYAPVSTWGNQGGQGAMTSFDPTARSRPNMVHPSMTRFIPRPSETLIRAEYQLPLMQDPEPPAPASPPPAPIEDLASRLPDISPGPAAAQRLQRSWDEILQARKVQAKKCQQIGINGASTALSVPVDAISGDGITIPMVLGGLLVLWLMTPGRTTGRR